MERSNNEISLFKLVEEKNYYNKVLNNWSYLGTDFKTTKVNKKISNHVIFYRRCKFRI